MADPAFPVVDDPLDGWQLVEETVETVFELPAARVRGATRRYEDERTRTAVQEATAGDVDYEWRFVAATRLGFEPSLPPGTAPMLLSTVRTEARRSFANRLAERGLTDVARERSEGVRVRSGARARVTRFEATDVVADREIPVTGWVGVWHDGGDFFVVTGGYPAVRLADFFESEGEAGPLTRPPARYRDELFDILRSVR